MKRFFILITVTLLYLSVAAQEKPNPVIKFMQITTVESAVSGGAGLSKMIITKEDGSQEEKEMGNLYNLSGFNSKKFKENEITIVKTLQLFSNQGWKLVSTVPLSPTPADKGYAILITRYLLMKEEN